MATIKNNAKRKRFPNGTVPKAVAEPNVTNAIRFPKEVIRESAEPANTPGYAMAAPMKPVACATPADAWHPQSQAEHLLGVVSEFAVCWNVGHAANNWFMLF